MPSNCCACDVLESAVAGISALGPVSGHPLDVTDKESFAAFLVPTIICTVIWIAVTGGGFFWPAFPMLFLGINLIKTVVNRESVIEREVLRLEEQAAKDTAPELPAKRGDPGEAKEGR